MGENWQVLMHFIRQNVQIKLITINLNKDLMHRCSSTCEVRIDFKPSQFQTGQSNISKLPLRMGARRHSLQNLDTKLSKKKPSKQFQTGLQLQLLEKKVSALEKENVMLRKQIEAYHKLDTLKKHSHSQLAKKEDIKTKVINRTKCSRITDCETALYSTKELSTEITDVSFLLNQMEEHYRKKLIKPSLVALYDLSSKYFQEYEHIYRKITDIFHNVVEQYPATVYRDMHALLDKHRPSRNVAPQKTKNERKASKVEGFSLEMMTLQETLQHFQEVLQKLIKSQKVIQILKHNETVKKLFKKLQE